MNYDISPLSIKKRPQRSCNKPVKCNLENTSKEHIPQSDSSENTASKVTETPVRKNSDLCDSPQFVDFAESPEFRVGWDDGFEIGKTGSKIKLDDAKCSSKKKSKWQVNVRTLRTQQLLASTCQPETVNVNDHPDSDDFFQWAESLLKSTDPSANLNNPAECFILSSSAKQSEYPCINSNEPESPKNSDKKTPKRPVHRTTRSLSYEKNSKRHSNENPISKLLSSEKKTKSPANCSKDEYSDFFNDSVNYLIVQCSQAVESKLNKENADLNLLDDSSNDLIMKCTQQVEENLEKQNVMDKSNNPTSYKLKISNSIRSANTKNSFVHKHGNLHKLDTSVDFNLDNNSMSNMGKQIISKEFNQDPWDTPDSKRDYNSSELSNEYTSTRWSSNQSDSSSRSGSKHFLSPSSRDESTSRKKFCHNNNILPFRRDRGKLVTGSSDQDLQSILNEDEDVLSTLDIEAVLSQVPSLNAASKPNHPLSSNPNTAGETKTNSLTRQDYDNSRTNQSSGSFKPNYKEPNQGSKYLQSLVATDVVPKYTQEQIMMKKIEAKRRQALKLRKQKSFEIK